MDTRISKIREEERKLCISDIDYYIDNYGHIEDKDAEETIQPFKLWKEQREALHSIMKHKLNIILKARQLGFSWLVLHIASPPLIQEGKTVIGLSKTEEEAKELVRRLGVIFRNMPALIAEKNFAPENWSGMVFDELTLSLTITFPNGRESVFKALPSSESAGRSFTANLIVFDEWAFQQFAEEIWKSGFPTINRPTGGKVIGLSTIKRGSLFEELFTDNDNGFNKIFIPWYADPRRDDEWYQKTKRALGDLITEEYPATIEEALTVPGGAYFPEVKRATHETKKELEGATRKYVCLDYGLDMLAAIWINVDVHGNAQAYRECGYPDLTASQACEMLLKITGDEHISLWLAPPDLWSRRQETGKSVYQIFLDSGISLTRTNNDMFSGCMGMKEWLQVRDDGKPYLTFLEGCCDRTIKCLQKLQKDKNKPSIYSKMPHDITHHPDALKCFCVWWVKTPNGIEEKGRKKWNASMWEDYKNASPEDRKYLIAKWGEPIK